ncbi:LysR substrate-binding domain-containing protein [Chitinimonas sp.]|uniref:LysR family transcriptional regulator n=1 Tax=Chitinimonas sp. TaxID=1934313 RepID=UPI0035AE5525
MDLDAITVFVKIVETGSISAAAKALDMPKTTVSSKLAALEKRLHVSLNTRPPRARGVTALGEQYFQHCVGAVRAIQNAETALQSSRQAPSGLLRISAPVDIAHALLPEIVSRYLSSYPDVSVELVVSNQLVDLLADAVDLAIRIGPLKDSSLIARRFFQPRFRLWAAPRYMQQLGSISTPDQLAAADFIQYRRSEQIALRHGTATQSLPVRSRTSSDDIETVKALMIRGEGIGWLPDFVAAEAAASGALLPVLPDWELDAPTKVFYLVHAGHKFTSRNVEAFIQIALETVGRADDIAGTSG